jgi:hypothetical protein
MNIKWSAASIAVVLCHATYGTLIYDNFGGTPISSTITTIPLSSTAETLLSLDLPGESSLNITRFNFNNENFFQISGVTLKQQLIGSYYYAQGGGAGLKWSDIIAANSENAWGNISAITDNAHSMGAGAVTGLRPEPTYIPFYFQDTSAGNADRYGYLALSTTLSGAGSSAEVAISISGWAYDDSGAQIGMGAIPEPSTALLLGMAGSLIFISRRLMM